MADSSREHDQDHAIILGTCWALHLTAEDDQLLTKERIFGNEFRLGTGEIGKGSCQH
jgi:hypothetical protein